MFDHSLLTGKFEAETVFGFFYALFVCLIFAILKRTHFDVPIRSRRFIRVLFLKKNLLKHTNTSINVYTSSNHLRLQKIEIDAVFRHSKVRLDFLNLLENFSSNNLSHSNRFGILQQLCSEKIYTSCSQNINLFKYNTSLSRIQQDTPTTARYKNTIKPLNLSLQQSPLPSYKYNNTNQFSPSSSTQTEDKPQLHLQAF